MTTDTQTDELEMIQLAPGIYHSADYRTWVYQGENWTFSAKPAHAIRLMMETFHRYGKRVWSDEEILSIVYRDEGWEGQTICKLMRHTVDRKQQQHPCWKTLIGPSRTRGIVELLIDPRP